MRLLSLTKCSNFSVFAIFIFVAFFTSLAVWFLNIGLTTYMYFDFVNEKRNRRTRRTATEQVSRTWIGHLSSIRNRNHFTAGLELSSKPFSLIVVSPQIFWRCHGGLGGVLPSLWPVNPNHAKLAQDQWPPYKFLDTQPISRMCAALGSGSAPANRKQSEHRLYKRRPINVVTVQFSMAMARALWLVVAFPPLSAAHIRDEKYRPYTRSFLLTLSRLFD